MTTSRPQNPFLRHGGKILLAVLVAGIAGHTYVETPGIAPFTWAFKWLLGPLIVTAILIVFLQKELLLRKFKSWPLVLFMMLAFLAACMACGAGYANIANTWVSQPKQVMISGEVIAKEDSQGPFGASKKIRIKNASTGDISTLTVSQDEFLRLNPGDLYRRTMTEGLLGFPFAPRGH